MGERSGNDFVTLEWRGRELTARLQEIMGRRVRLCAERVTNQVRRNISISTRARGPSRPGEFPHADTGRLRQSIFWRQVGPFDAIVGTNLLYGLFLEYGTIHMAQRSFLRRTLFEMKDEILAVMTRGTVGGEVALKGMDR